MISLIYSFQPESCSYDEAPLLRKSIALSVAEIETGPSMRKPGKVILYVYIFNLLIWKTKEENDKKKQQC